MAFLEYDNNGKTQSLVLSEKITYIGEQAHKLNVYESQTDCQAAVFKSSRGWVILDYTGSKTYVNGLRVADCKLMREGDHIQIGNITSRLCEMVRKEILSEGSPCLAPDVKCMFDHCGFEIGDEVVYCPGCGRPYHSDCWLANKESCDCSYQCSYQKPKE